MIKKPMEIRKFVSRILESNMYVLIEKSRVIVIDPCVSLGSINDIIDGRYEVDFILLTHEHYDHIAYLNKFKQVSNAKVVGTIACAEALNSPARNLAAYFSVLRELIPHQSSIDMTSIDADYRSELDIAFEKTLQIDWEGHAIKIVSTPGHSPGSSCILVDDNNLFSGDTLIFDSTPITRLPNGSPKQWDLCASLFLKSLPAGTKVFPGHMDEFHLGMHHLFNEQNAISTNPSWRA